MDYLLPLIYVLFVWWFSTGAILYLDGLPDWTRPWTMAGATAVLGASFYGLAVTSGDATMTGAYVGFACAIGIWGWNETAFLLGYVTGPRRTACGHGCRGLRHAWHATETILYHELALAASGLAMLAVSWGAANQAGIWTFGVLWAMRLSTKLNIFLGVPQTAEEFLPPRLDHLRRYFTRKPMNALFPVSVTAATAAAVVSGMAAADAASGTYAVTAHTVICTLIVLALMEHWFLVLPLPVAALWTWGMRSRQTADRTRERKGGCLSPVPSDGFEGRP
ncbi:MAG: putative photosynthetic complex assembly protein PuhE [Minwuia sp.]|uniref:putative photosynthetic complex assembly protein PuhE n=1 Tax=Minwuia sp. TaxID=2493630 RepID=UPI003A858EC4